MSTDPATAPDRISLADDELRSILERAATLDAARVTGMTVEDLRQIAIETGISTESLAIALREAEAGRLPAPPPRAAELESPAEPEPTTRIGGLLRRVPGWIRTSAIAWGSAIAGLFAGVSIEEFDTGAFFIGALVVLVWSSIELSVFHRKRGSLLTVQRDLLALWLPFTVVGSLPLGRDGDEFFAIMSLIWLVVAIVGGLITLINPPRDKGTKPAD